MLGWLKRRTVEQSDERPIPPQPPAARDWSCGDVAKCIASGTWIVHPSRTPTRGPACGQLLRVRDVSAHHDTVWLAFDGFDNGYFPAGFFRKLRPCTTDFREQLSRPAELPKIPALPELVR
jgi:hypothetical protein